MIGLVDPSGFNQTRPAGTPGYLPVGSEVGAGRDGTGPAAGEPVRNVGRFARPGIRWGGKAIIVAPESVRRVGAPARMLVLSAVLLFASGRTSGAAGAPVSLLVPAAGDVTFYVSLPPPRPGNSRPTWRHLDRRTTAASRRRTGPHASSALRMRRSGTLPPQCELSEADAVKATRQAMPIACANPASDRTIMPVATSRQPAGTRRPGAANAGPRVERGASGLAPESGRPNSVAGASAPPLPPVTFS